MFKKVSDDCLVLTSQLNSTSIYGRRCQTSRCPHLFIHYCITVVLQTPKRRQRTNVVFCESWCDAVMTFSSRLTIGLPPKAVKTGRPKHLCPSTGGACPRARPWSRCGRGSLVATSRTAWGSGPGCHPEKNWNFRCKFLLLAHFQPEILVLQNANTTHCNSRLYYMHPAQGNTKKY